MLNDANYYNFKKYLDINTNKYIVSHIGTSHTDFVKGYYQLLNANYHERHFLVEAMDHVGSNSNGGDWAYMINN